MQQRAVESVSGCVFQVYMASQSMLIVLVGFTPHYHVEQQQQVPSGAQGLVQKVVFTEDVDSIVTEVSCQDSAVPNAV